MAIGWNENLVITFEGYLNSDKIVYKAWHKALYFCQSLLSENLSFLNAFRLGLYRTIFSSLR